MARPRKYVDPEMVRKLAELGMPVTDIARILEVSDDTIHRRFAAEVEKGFENLKKALRAAQIKSALGGNVVMLIFLGKQYLGQKDVHETEVKSDNLVLKLKYE